VPRLFLDHGTRVEVSRTTFVVSKCLEIGAEVSQSVLMPKFLVAEVSGNRRNRRKSDYVIEPADTFRFPILIAESKTGVMQDDRPVAI